MSREVFSAYGAARARRPRWRWPLAGVCVVGAALAWVVRMDERRFTVVTAHGVRQLTPEMSSTEVKALFGAPIGSEVFEGRPCLRFGMPSLGGRSFSVYVTCFQDDKLAKSFERRFTSTVITGEGG